MDDPHIHVAADIGAGLATRKVLASTFGLVADSPSVVESGCGRDVPVAMTSRKPESVTCLPCREHAAAQHREAAEQVERLARMGGFAHEPDRVQLAVQAHKELSRRFADPNAT